LQVTSHAASEVGGRDGCLEVIAPATGFVARAVDKVAAVRYHARVYLIDGMK
jgi:hypothetical protein